MSRDTRTGAELGGVYRGDMAELNALFQTVSVSVSTPLKLIREILKKKSVWMFPHKSSPIPVAKQAVLKPASIPRPDWPWCGRDISPEPIGLES